MGLVNTIISATVRAYTPIATLPTHSTALVVAAHQPTAAADHITSGYVYFIISSNYPVDSAVKIGHTKNLTRRLRELQTGTPYTLRIYKHIYSADCIALEARLHARYASHNIAREWFRLTLAEVDTAVAQVDMAVAQAIQSTTTTPIAQQNRLGDVMRMINTMAYRAAFYYSRHLFARGYRQLTR
jgi:hypothetical protein